jgi:hypothetical protein
MSADWVVAPSQPEGLNLQSMVKFLRWRNSAVFNEATRWCLLKVVVTRQDH